MSESKDTPADAPMNRAERRHLAKHGSVDKLHDFRAQQSQHAMNAPGGGIVTPMKRGAVHRKTGS